MMRGEGAVILCAPVLLGLSATVAANAARVGATLTPDGEDEEAVHDFRVALRRLRTLLRPARPLFQPGALRDLGRELGALGRRTGRLRDEEVLRETLLDLQVDPITREGLAAWLDRRGRAERRLRRLAKEELCGPGFAPVLERLRLVLEAPRRDTSPLRFAHRAFEGPIADARHFARLPVTRATEMHELRIRVKRIRYAADLFAGASNVGPWPEISAKAAVLQKQLGTLHDFDEALIRLRRARSLPHRVLRQTTLAARLARKALAVSIAPVVGSDVEQLADGVEAALEAWRAALVDELGGGVRA